MNRIKILGVALVCYITLTSNKCGFDTTTSRTSDVQKTITIAKNLEQRQPTPTDIEYSLERWLLTRRAYWVNGQREKARMFPCPIADPPLGYIVLFLEGVGVVGKFIVEGKVVSLNSFLSPDSEFYEYSGYSSSGSGTFTNRWLSDVDGSYGTNDNGIFFFTPDGKYLEWNGIYLYSDIPFEVKDPVIKIGRE